MNGQRQEAVTIDQGKDGPRGGGAIKSIFAISLLSLTEGGGRYKFGGF